MQQLRCVCSAEAGLLEPLKHLTKLTRLELAAEIGSTFHLPPSLTILTGLTAVKLRQGGVEVGDESDAAFEVPKHWTRLQSLDSDRFLGRVPGQITRLVALRHLAVRCMADYNDRAFLLRHVASVVQLRSLESLEIENQCNCHAAWPGWTLLFQRLHAMPSLSAIAFSGNDLSAANMTFSSKVTSLTFMDANLSTIPVAISSLPMLRHLELMNNPIEEIPAGCYLEHLQDLGLMFCELRQSPMQLLKASNLRKLYLQGDFWLRNEDPEYQQLKQHLGPMCSIELSEDW